MCNECLSYHQHRAGCPNAQETEAIGSCVECGGNIEEGESYIELDISDGVGLFHCKCVDIKYLCDALEQDGWLYSDKIIAMLEEEGAYRRKIAEASY